MGLNRTNLAVVSWILPLGWATLIFLLSAKSDVPKPDIWLPPFADKIVHGLIFAVLSCLLYLALRLSGVRYPSAIALAIVLTSLYGVMDEWHQSMVPGRTPDPLDWLADTLGAGLVVPFAHAKNAVLRRLGIALP